MPFQLPTLPNFQVNTPQFDPLGQQAKLVQLKTMLGQQQLLPLQQQELQQRIQGQQTANQTSQVELQQKNLELQSQQAMIKAWSDPEFTKKLTSTEGADSSGLGFDPNAMTSELVTRGVLPAQATALTDQFIKRSQSMAEVAKTNAQAGEANASTQSKGLKMLADRIGAVLDAPVGKAQPLLDALKQDALKNAAKLFPGVPQEDLAHVFAADLGHLPAMASVIGLDSQIADFHKSKADAVKAEQEVIPENGGMSPATKQQVQKDIAVATNPQIQAGKVAVAEAEGRGKAQIEHEFAVRNNSALSNVPTHLVAPATADAQKANKEWADAKSVVDRMAATMDAANKGNVVSYQIIPQEGTLQLTTSQGVHRINKTEIDQYSGGGSLWQRLEGHIGKALSGKSIPDSVLQDMREIQQIQAEGARSRYENTLSSINQTYGSNFQPVEMKGLGGKYTPPVGAPTATGPNGHKIVVDQGKWVDALTGKPI